jgi:hypothetical protein
MLIKYHTVSWYASITHIILLLISLIIFIIETILCCTRDTGTMNIHPGSCILNSLLVCPDVSVTLYGMTK